jgi:hypothetical protein
MNKGKKARGSDTRAPPMKDVFAMIAGKIHHRQFGAPNAPLHPVGGRAVVDPRYDIFSRVTIAPHGDERGLRFGVGIQMFSEFASKGGALFDENLRQFRVLRKTTSASQERTILALSVAAASTSTRSSNLKPRRMPRAWFRNQRLCTTEMILIRSANSRRKFELPIARTVIDENYPFQELQGGLFS